LPRDAIDVGGDERPREDLLEVSRRGVLTGVLVPKDMAKSFIVFFHVFDFLPEEPLAIVRFGRHGRKLSGHVR